MNVALFRTEKPRQRPPCLEAWLYVWRWFSAKCYCSSLCSCYLQILHKDASKRGNARLVALDIWYCTPLTAWWTSPGRKVSGAMRSNLCVKAQIATAVCLRSDQWRWNSVHNPCVRAQIATALCGSLCLRSDQWRWNIGTVFTAWQSVSLSDQWTQSGTSHPVVVSGICAGTYTYKKLNKVTSVLRLIPRPVHNQMPNVSNISALPPLCLTNTWERSHSLCAVFGSNNPVFLVTLYRLLCFCAASAALAFISLLSPFSRSALAFPGIDLVSVTGASLLLLRPKEYRAAAISHFIGNLVQRK